MYKFELHAHTAECDNVATLSAADHVRLCAKKGYSGIVITDHYLSDFFNLYKEEIGSTEREKVITRWLKGYYTAKNEGEKLGVTVLCGAELRVNGNPNDYLIYGLDDSDYLALPFLHEAKNIHEAIKLLTNRALVVQAHPFRNYMTIYDPSHLFGIEVYNACTEDFRNDFALTYAKQFNKAFTSGSDSHHENAACKGGILTETKIKTNTDLIAVLKGGNYELIRP